MPSKKIVSPAHKKEVVEAAVKEGVCSGRTGCRVLKLARSTFWYQSGRRTSRQAELVKRIHALSEENPRYGYRRIAALLRQEGLRVPPTKRRVVGRGRPTGLPTKATHKNHVWTWDFIADATTRGGAIRMLTVLDEHTRECHVLGADRAEHVFVSAGPMETILGLCKAQRSARFARRYPCFCQLARGEKARVQRPRRDQTIKLNSVIGRKGCPDTLRRISSIDPQTGNTLVFVTKQFDLDALMIAQIYRRGWAIELFFRWIRQHLRLRGFHSTSFNGVRAQIRTAICAYLLLTIAKPRLNLANSLWEILQVVSIASIEQVPIAELLTPINTSHAHIESRNQLKINYS